MGQPGAVGGGEREQAVQFYAYAVSLYCSLIGRRLVFSLGLKRIPSLSNPNPNRVHVVETNTEYPRIPLHKIRFWNLIEYWLSSKQKRTICEIISSLIDIKQWRLVFSKTEKVPWLSGGHNLNRFNLVQLRWSLCQSQNGRPSNRNTCYHRYRAVRVLSGTG